MIERKLPKAALVTTKGFRDVPEIRRGTKLDLWDAYNDVAEPYIKRRDRFELDERVGCDGTMLKEVSEDEIRELARILKRREVEAIAICFMNAYVNPENQRITKEILQEELPEPYICT
ncbi:hydantoinase/oxoprolinase N-terminal domain-containing protein, partial [Staphylococcus epidermidis]|uniref:hydantoinase/oxoprolinase N-terminal domain-containing protein n=1 Tax=Staphylococcus epidermidis TaxID=1282 RepID=UPI0028CB7CA4